MKISHKYVVMNIYLYIYVCEHGEMSDLPLYMSRCVNRSGKIKWHSPLEPAPIGVMIFRNWPESQDFILICMDPEHESIGIV